MEVKKIIQAEVAKTMCCETQVSDDTKGKSHNKSKTLVISGLTKDLCSINCF